MTSRNKGLTKELYLILNFALVIMCVFLSDRNKILLFVLGIFFFVLSAHALATRHVSRFYKLLFSIFSPFFFTVSYIYIFYLLKYKERFPTNLKNSYGYFLSACVLSDIMYCLIFPEKVYRKYSKSDSESSNSSGYKSNIEESNEDIKYHECDNISDKHLSEDKTQLNIENTYDFHIKPISFDPDDYFSDAGSFIIEMNKASIGMLQRKFNIGYNRAARIMDQLFTAGVVGPEEGAKPRKILMNKEQFQFLTDNIQEIKLEIGLNDNIISESSDRNKSFDNTTGQEFEWFCAKLLEKNGFEDVKVTSASGDFGVDITAIQNYILYAIQCKCYSSDIGVDAVYQISGGMKYYNANVGIVLTNRYFTKQAKELANNIGIILWDRDFLLKLIEKSN